MLRRLIAPAAAAALSVMITAPLVAEHAAARPVGPGISLLERLQIENQNLRQELRLALDQRQEIARGLDRLEQINRHNRDARSARRIASLIHDLELRTGLDQPWQFGDDDRPDRPYAPGYTPPPAATPPGYPTSSGPVYVPPPAPGSRPGVIVVDRRPQPPIALPAAMNATDFAGLLAAVRDASFTEQQLSIVRGAAQHAYFTVDQIIALLAQARFEEARVEIAVVTGARVVDPERWFLIEKSFHFSGSAETVRQRLSATGPVDQRILPQ